MLAEVGNKLIRSKGIFNLVRSNYLGIVSSVVQKS